MWSKNPSPVEAAQVTRAVEVEAQGDVGLPGLPFDDGRATGREAALR